MIYCGVENENIYIMVRDSKICDKIVVLGYIRNSEKCEYFRSYFDFISDAMNFYKDKIMNACIMLQYVKRNNTKGGDAID